MENKTTKFQTEQPEVYTINEVARKLNVSEQTARKIMKQPQFPSFKLGSKVLVRIKDFDDWFENIVGKEVTIDENANKFKE